MHAPLQTGVSANKAAVLKVGSYRFTFRTDDSLLVEHEGGSASYAGEAVASSTSWGSGPVATVLRQAWIVNGETYWVWQVMFANGGYFRCLRRYAKRGNSHLNLWVRMPAAVASTASGLCSTSCSAVPKLPYTSCGGEASCLPVRMSDTIFSSSIITVRTPTGFVRMSRVQPRRAGLESMCSTGVARGWQTPRTPPSVRARVCLCVSLCT